jgi:hypothetical protein
LAAALIGCRQAVGFQFGERGVENGFGDAHRAAEFAGHACAQAGVNAGASHPKYWSGTIEVAASVPV